MFKIFWTEYVIVDGEKVSVYLSAVANDRYTADHLVENLNIAARFYEGHHGRQIENVSMKEIHHV